MAGPQKSRTSTFMILGGLNTSPKDPERNKIFEDHLRKYIRAKDWAAVDKILTDIDPTKCGIQARELLVKLTDKHKKHLTCRETFMAKHSSYSSKSYNLLQAYIKRAFECRPKGKGRVDFERYFAHFEEDPLCKYLTIQCRAYLYCKYYLNREYPQSLLFHVKSNLAKKVGRQWEYVLGTKYKITLYLKDKIESDCYLILNKDGTVELLKDESLYKKIKFRVKKFLT